MSTNLSFSEQLTYSTVRIECQSQSGDVGTGTGFFFRFWQDEQNMIPLIVTNKHVVEGAQVGRFHMTRMRDDGRVEPSGHEEMILDNFEHRWIKHPDPDVDLCVMPIGHMGHLAKQQGKKFFFCYLDKTGIPTAEELSQLTALEDVIMIGYPNGIWDSTNNLPIIRRGITATHPNVDYNGKKEFMIDAACFPGSSGSPVLLFNQGGYSDRADKLIAGTRIRLLGVLYAGPVQSITGEVGVIQIPTNQQAIAVSQIPINLGIVIKSVRILDFEDTLKRLIASGGNV